VDRRPRRPLFEDDFESYGGDEALLYANWIGAGPALSNTHANSGTWSIGDHVGAYYGRGITKDPDKAIVFAMQVCWAGNTPATLVGAISFTQFAAWNFWDQQCSLQFLEGGDIHFFGAPGVGQTSGVALRLNRIADGDRRGGRADLSWQRFASCDPLALLSAVRGKPLAGGVLDDGRRAVMATNLLSGGSYYYGLKA